MVDCTREEFTSIFQLTNLWGGTSCGREEDCTTCYQGSEVVPDCTRQSILYENFSKCVPAARGKKPLDKEQLEAKEAEVSRSVVRTSGPPTREEKKIALW